MVAPLAQLDLFDGLPPQPPPPPRLRPAPGPLSGAPAGTQAVSVEPSEPGPTRPIETGATLSPTRSQREALLGGQRVTYRLRRARRRSIGFVVGPEGLTVSAPRWVGVAEIEAALAEKASWILRKLQEQDERARRTAAARIEWRDGAELPFLGQPVRIVVDPTVTGALLDATEAAPRGAASVASLRLGLPHPVGPEQMRDVVQSWLQRQAQRLFEERASYFAQRLGVRVRRLSLSSAATRWGSASADGSVRLNWRLVHFGLPVIDYVVAHELAHLREMNHSEAFWEVVRSVVPDVESARERLRDEVLPVLD